MTGERSAARRCRDRRAGARGDRADRVTRTSRPWPPTSIGSGPGLAPIAHRESIGERLLRLYRRHELPVLLVVAYILMRAALLVWQGI